jgi:hypothetical protein
MKKFPEPVVAAVIDLALAGTELPPRELATASVLRVGGPRYIAFSKRED